ncbi:MAG: beta-lactamase family protein [Gemmatimonadaceae bacterium]|nr:beta-lactamase family protein [Gemmatimonadaceae bacterium]
MPRPLRLFVLTRSLTRALTLLLPLSACAPRPAAPAAPRIPTAAQVDSTARALMQREHVQGLALAVIDTGAVMHVAAYGVRNAAGDPLTPRTVMYGASLTKTAFAYLVLQLVDEGRLDLDASIATLLPRPLPEYEDYRDLAGDPRWKALTMRILLTHTTGFANFRWLESDGRLRFHSDPGTRYGYSGEGLYIAQLVLEEGLRLDVGREMQQRLFDRFGMTRTAMQWRPDFRPDLADGFKADGTPEPHDERSSVSAAGSMDTDIADQARLWAAIVRGDGLSRAARAELVRPQAPITSAHQFPTLAPETDPANAAIGLAAGLGLVTFRGPRGAAWFKGGHNDWTGNMVVCVEQERRCLVMLSNDVRAERLYPDLVRAVLGDVGMPWRWEYEWFTQDSTADHAP